MAPDQCFSSRVFWALVLWSWCGPEKSEDGAVLRKTTKGFYPRDMNDQPMMVPARQKDILELLGLGEIWKGHMSRVVAHLSESGQLWTDDDGIMYVDPCPPAFEDLESVDSTVNQKWQIADRTVRFSDLDPVDSTLSIECLEELSTAWKTALNELRTVHRKLLVQAISEGRILIDKKRESRREEESSSSSAVPEPPYEGKEEEEEPAALVLRPPDEPPGPAEHPASWATFKEAYPPDHLDGPKAKPLFEALSPQQKRNCIERLQVYRQCPRWQKSPQYIPLASNWLQSAYDEPPPPFYERKPGKKGFTEEVMGEFQRQFNKWGEVL
jgi:hypothetical protein